MKINFDVFPKNNIKQIIHSRAIAYTKEQIRKKTKAFMHELRIYKEINKFVHT